MADAMAVVEFARLFGPLLGLPPVSLQVTPFAPSFPNIGLLSCKVVNPSAMVQSLS